MKTKKRIFSILLCGIMIFSMCPQAAYAEESTGESIGIIDTDTKEAEIVSCFGGTDNVEVNAAEKCITLKKNVTVSQSVVFAGGTWKLDIGTYTLSGESGQGKSITPLIVKGQDTILALKGTGTIAGGNESGRNVSGRSEPGGNGIEIYGGELHITESSEITFQGGLSGSSQMTGTGGHGIIVDDGGIIQGGNIVSKGGSGGTTLQGVNSGGYGIWVKSGKVSADDIQAVGADAGVRRQYEDGKSRGGYGICIEENGEVSAKSIAANGGAGGTNGTPGSGILVKGELKVTGAITASGAKGGFGASAIEINGGVVIAEGDITASGGAGAIYYDGGPGILLENGGKIAAASITAKGGKHGGNGGNGANGIKGYDGTNVTVENKLEVEGGDGVIAMPYNGKEATWYTLSLDVENGSADEIPYIVSSTKTVAAGIEIFVEANEPPSEEKRFKCWQIEPSEGTIQLDDEYSSTTFFIMPAEDTEVKLTAQYETIPSHTVTVVNGTGDGTYREGQTVTIKANPSAEGQMFSHWEITAGNAVLADITDAETTFSMPEKDITVEACYKEITYPVTVIGGSGSGNYKKGDTVAIKPEVPEGKRFAGWTITPETTITYGSVNTDSATFVMPGEPVTVTANFQTQSGGGFVTYYDITAMSPENGTIKLECDRIYRYGDVAVTLIPKDGYKVKELLINGESVGAVDSYTIKSVTEDIYVAAVFEETELHKNARLQEGVEATTIRIYSMSKGTASRGKGWIKIWYEKSPGYKVDYYEVFRSKGNKKHFGKTAFYTTKKNGATGWYKNNKSLKKGTRYYYKIRGVRVIDGKKCYTKWSNIIYRTAK